MGNRLVLSVDLPIRLDGSADSCCSWFPFAVRLPSLTKGLKTCSSVPRFLVFRPRENPRVFPGS